MGGLVLASLAAIIALPLFGALLGAVQAAWYRRQVAAGRMTEDDVPFFGILMLRGMLVGFVLVAIAAINANIATPPQVNQPPAPRTP
jgi:hypothetical protein